MTFPSRSPKHSPRLTNPSYNPEKPFGDKRTPEQQREWERVLAELKARDEPATEH